MGCGAGSPLQGVSAFTLLPRGWERALWPPSDCGERRLLTLGFWNGHSWVPMGRGEHAIASPPPLRQLLNLPRNEGEEGSPLRMARREAAFLRGWEASGAASTPRASVTGSTHRQAF